MRIDFESGTVMEQAVEDVGRLMGRGPDDRDVIGAMLVRDAGIRREARIDAILGVEITRAATPFARPKELAIGGRCSTLTPGRRNRQRWWASMIRASAALYLSGAM